MTTLTPNAQRCIMQGHLETLKMMYDIGVEFTQAHIDLAKEHKQTKVASYLRSVVPPPCPRLLRTYKGVCLCGNMGSGFRSDRLDVKCDQCIN